MTMGTYSDAPAAGRVAGLRAFGRLIAVATLAHAPLIAILALYFASAIVVARLHGGLAGQDFTALSLTFVTFMLPIMLVAIVTLRFLNLVLHERPRHPTIALIRDVRDFTFHPRRAANALPVIVIMFCFIKVFAFYKANIPLIMPFSWDMAFMEWDRMLHFGTDPWVWLQPLLGYAPVTFLVNVSYNVWFMVMWIMWVAFAFQAAPSALRTRFFIAFMLLWSVGGSLLAILLSSAGPAYFERLGLTPDPYAPLMGYLHAVNETLPLWALNTQDILWRGYLGEQDVIVGISAMPSMHNASSLLFALAAWKLDRRLGIVMSAYAALIFLGSIHLAWHYAIDAYLAFAVTGIVWWVSGRIAAWNERMPWTRAHAALCARGESA